MSVAGAGKEPRLPRLTRTWNLAEPAAPEVVRRLVAELKLPEPVCSLLAVRGFGDPDDAKTYLRPSAEALHDPALLADGEVAAERIAAAVRSGETVFVHGDYDVDGICATALLTRWLRSLGGTVVPFVPHRLRDGYDFGPTGLAAAREAGATLIVTADCGTVAHETVAAAADIDVIVTDHHTVSDTLPSALAVVNPQRQDCPYPDTGLCGTGVAYKLCELVGRALEADTAPLAEYLDLVALATVADLVPLRGENRILVHFGLRRFPHSRIQGLSDLLQVAKVAPDQATSGRLGFTVAPRINAAGRIGESSDALRLLLSEDRLETRRLAGQLDEINRERRAEDERTLGEAIEQLEGDFDAQSDFGVVVAGEGWHPGVIGIVASRVVERVHRPVVLLAIDGDRARGSARSIPGFHLYDALAECREHLLRFGGHAQAAGMDLALSELDAFREHFNRVAREQLGGTTPVPVLRADAEVSLGSVDLQLAHWMRYMEPHGMGNPGPLLVVRGARVEGARVVGDGHLKATLSAGPTSLDAIGFRMADAHPPAELNGGRYDVAFRLERNEFRGRTTAQAKLVDLRPSAGAS